MTTYTHDPITGEDVRIECSNAHRSTDSQDIEGESLPVLIESDFRHDPVEGCQGSSTSIIEIEGGCPNCGYDRANASHHTLAGVHREVCRACGVDITERHRDDYEPSYPRDPVDSLKRSCEYIGRTSSHSSGISLYQRNERLFSLLDETSGSQFTVNGRELISLLIMILQTQYDEDDNPLSTSDGRQLLRNIVSVMENKNNDEDTQTNDN